MARRTGGFNFGGKLFLVLVAAAVLGFGWAMVETGRGPGDILKLFRGKGNAETGRPPEPVKPVEPARRESRPEPAPAKVEAPVRPDPKPVEPKTYTGASMQALFMEVENLLRRGAVKEARDKVRGFNKLLVPAEHAAAFRELEGRVDLYHRLLLETSPGAAVPMPEMAEIVTTSGTRGILVKNLVETSDEYVYETLTGIRSRLPKSSVRELTKLAEPGRRAAAVDYELERMCQHRAVAVTKTGAAWGFQAGPGVTGLAFFDLADFCARNGHHVRLVPLFDEALRRDAGILATVHEAKGERMVNVFIYFISLHAKEDARTAYGILKARYRDTRVYRERVEGDRDVADAYQGLVGEAIATSATPARPDPEPARPDPEPDPPKPDARPVEGADPKPIDTSATPLPEGAPEAAVRLVRQGDARFSEAMRRLRNSDPNFNPDGWAAENKAALDLFGLAFVAYESAQGEFEKAGRSIPPALLKRVRETQTSRSLCRKRAVSSK